MARLRATSASTTPPVARKFPKVFNLLGLDPGTNSFAYSVLQATLGPGPSKLKLKVLQHGMIDSTMRDLRYPQLLAKQLVAYKECILSLTAQYDIKAIIAERYMLRRGSGGTAIESINLMLGILLDLGYPTRLTPAVQWKNAMRRSDVNLDELYAEGKTLKVTPHQIDATHIAAFGMSSLTGRNPDMSDLLEQLATKDRVCLGESTKKDVEVFTGVKRKPRKRKPKP